MVLPVRIRPILAFYLFAVGILMLALAGQSVMIRHDPEASPWSDFTEWLSARKLPQNALSLGWFALAHHRLYLLLYLLEGASPSIAAIIVAFLGWGKRGVIWLCQRLKPWGRDVTRLDGLKVYVVLGTVLWLITALLSSDYLFPGSRYLFAESRKSPEVSPLLGLVYGLSIPLFDVGGALEELGWRGFALPHLEKRVPSPLAATIFLGTLWSAWHLPSWTPRFWISREPQEWIAEMSAFFLGTTALAILMTYLFHRTGGSILPTIILHGTANLWIGSDHARLWRGVPILHYLGFSNVLIICAAIIVILKTGSQLGRVNDC